MGVIYKSKTLSTLPPLTRSPSPDRGGFFGGVKTPPYVKITVGNAVLGVPFKTRKQFCEGGRIISAPTAIGQDIKRRDTFAGRKNLIRRLTATPSPEGKARQSDTIRPYGFGTTQHGGRRIDGGDSPPQFVFRKSAQKRTALRSFSESFYQPGGQPSSLPARTWKWRCGTLCPASTP